MLCVLNALNLSAVIFIVHIGVVPIYFTSTYFLRSIAIFLLVLLTNTIFHITQILRYYSIL